MSPTTSINILVDDRERFGQVLQALRAFEDVSVATRRLPLGDYQVDGRLLVERKTLHDFALSIIDGRLFNQMTRLATAPQRGVLILEGRSRDFQNSGIRREALQGALITTSLMLGIAVLRSFDPGETARLTVFAGRQLKIVATGGIPRGGYRPKGKRRRQLYILQSLPGVGPVRADRLLDRFGNVQNVLNAGLERLATVKGIGVDTAESIRQAVSEPRSACGIDADGLMDL